jgi:ATP-dependent RNA helicase HelY
VSSLAYAFDLDPFQRRAMAELDAGRSVLVAAPTSSGKTVVAEHAVADALATGTRCFYTTPIKALSNQKFHDLADRFGSAAVGLLTGDNAVQGDAPVVVMTTEVLRNMIYSRSAELHDLRWVVLDEVHYLEDTYRGPVWEEVILHLPAHVRLVCLSATVSNAEELADWISSVRGPTTAIVEHRRPVELRNLYLVGDRTTDRLHLLPTLVDDRPNPEGHRFDREPTDGRKGGKARRRRVWYTPGRLEVLDRLLAEDLLPAIVFVFSRAGCDDAARACVDAGFRLTTPEERDRIRAIVDDRLGGVPDADLRVLGVDRFVAGLEAGIAAHHAGMVPPFKETVEVLFAQGLVKLVFATETLALGINMPARTVVIERLSKFTGDHHEPLTPGQYTQLTGRAGRRGLDPLGHAVVLWSPFATFDQVAALAASREYVLRSAFRPTYNMAVNLVRRHEDRAEALDLLARSFAQYQADRVTARSEHRIAQLQGQRRQLVEALTVNRRDLEALRLARLAWRQDRLEAEGGAPGIVEATSRLRPGDVLVGVAGAGRAAVLSVAYRKGGSLRIRLVDADGDVQQITTDDLVEPPLPSGRVELPEPYQPNSHAFCAEVAARVRRARVSQRGERRTEARRRSTHPLERHPAIDAQLRTLDRLERIEAELDRLRDRARRSADSLVRRFDGVLAVLDAWGYVEGWRLTDRGRTLLRVFHEVDLLVAEAVARGLLDDLDPPTLAGVVSCFTYEHRSPEAPPPPWYPSPRVRDRVAAIEALGAELADLEAEHRLPVGRRPDPTFLPLAYAWASGQDLEDVLEDELLAGGDFVRHVKLLVDLLGQLREVASPATAAVAADAADRLQRGVVAVSGMVRPDDDDEADDDDDDDDDDEADEADDDDDEADAHPGTEGGHPAG